MLLVANQHHMLRRPTCTFPSLPSLSSRTNTLDPTRHLRVKHTDLYFTPPLRAAGDKTRIRLYPSLHTCISQSGVLLVQTVRRD